MLYSAKRAANDLARYQLGILKARVANGELPVAGAPLVRKYMIWFSF